MTSLTERPPRQMLNKVPEVTLYFWIIKIMATTVGETAADYFAHFYLKLGAIWAFWIAYVLRAVQCYRQDESDMG